MLLHGYLHSEVVDFIRDLMFSYVYFVTIIVLQINFRQFQ